FHHAQPILTPQTSKPTSQTASKSVIRSAPPPLPPRARGSPYFSPRHGLSDIKIRSFRYTYPQQRYMCPGNGTPYTSLQSPKYPPSTTRLIGSLERTGQESQDTQQGRTGRGRTRASFLRRRATNQPIHHQPAN